MFPHVCNMQKHVSPRHDAAHLPVGQAGAALRAGSRLGAVVPAVQVTFNSRTGGRAWGAPPFTGPIPPRRERNKRPTRRATQPSYRRGLIGELRRADARLCYVNVRSSGLNHPAIAYAFYSSAPYRSALGRLKSRALPLGASLLPATTPLRQKPCLCPRPAGPTLVENPLENVDFQHGL